jgi:hypothetical protein
MSFAEELMQLAKAGREKRLKDEISRVLRHVERGYLFSVDDEFEHNEAFSGVKNENRHDEVPFGGKEPFCAAELIRREKVVGSIRDAARRLYSSDKDLVYTSESAIDIMMVQKLHPDLFTATVSESSGHILLHRPPPVKR